MLTSSTCCTGVMPATSAPEPLAAAVVEIGVVPANGVPAMLVAPAVSTSSTLLKAMALALPLVPRPLPSRDSTRNWVLFSARISDCAAVALARARARGAVVEDRQLQDILGDRRGRRCCWP